MPQSAERLPEPLLAWVERSLGRNAKVVAWARLTGGLTSNVHRLTIERRGRPEHSVLRWWRSTPEWDAWIVRAVQRETAILGKLEGTKIPTPRVIASTTKATLGGPAILMTCLPGAMQLMPADRDGWLRQMAQTLVRIHALTLDANSFDSWLDHHQLSPPPDASRHDIWTAAIALVTEERAPARTCFLHRDYQHFNLLWSRDRLTGVVDWSEACLGPPEVDVGHCRLNLTLLFSSQVADRFREIYEAESGHQVDAWWDVHALLSYGPGWKEFLPVQIDGRAPFDAAGMTARMEQVLDGALRRL